LRCTQITYADLRFQKQIGEGSFGRVYLAKWRETTVAVKLLHRQAADHQDDDLPAIRTQRDDPILIALQRVRCSAVDAASLSVLLGYQVSPDAEARQEVLAQGTWRCMTAQLLLCRVLPATSGW
jgi:serine/threonine protein kinase